MFLTVHPLRPINKATNRGSQPKTVVIIPVNGLGASATAGGGDEIGVAAATLASTMGGNAQLC